MGNEIKERLYSAGLVFPEYYGNSISNLISGLSSLLGMEETMIADFHPLSKEYTEWINTEIDRVALIILDGLGYEMLEEYITNNPESFFSDFKSQGKLLKLTSVVPSTTAVAMTSIWFGLPPAVHSIAGFEIFLKEVGCIANILRFSPRAARAAGILEDYGISAEKFVRVKGISEIIVQQGIQVFSFLNKYIIDSPLSRAIHRGIKNKIGIINLWDELYLLGEMLIKETPPLLLVAYWPALDGLAHYYGPSHKVWHDEMESISIGLKKLVERLPDSVLRKTLFVVTADHGFCCSPPSNSINLMNIEELNDKLLMLPTGESRFVYLTLKNGFMEEAIDILHERLGDEFLILKSKRAFEEGLFGPPNNTAFLDRIGDVIITPIGRKNIVWNRDDEINELIGRHGGLTQNEMLVPFLAAVFD